MTSDQQRIFFPRPHIKIKQLLYYALHLMKNQLWVLIWYQL